MKLIMLMNDDWTNIWKTIYKEKLKKKWRWCQHDPGNSFFVFFFSICHYCRIFLRFSSECGCCITVQCMINHVEPTRHVHFCVLVYFFLSFSLSLLCVYFFSLLSCIQLKSFSMEKTFISTLIHPFPSKSRARHTVRNDFFHMDTLDETDAVAPHLDC